MFINKTSEEGPAHTNAFDSTEVETTPLVPTAFDEQEGPATILDDAGHEESESDGSSSDSDSEPQVIPLYPRAFLNRISTLIMNHLTENLTFNE